MNQLHQYLETLPQQEYVFLLLPSHRISLEIPNFVFIDSSNKTAFHLFPYFVSSWECLFQ